MGNMRNLNQFLKRKKKTAQRRRTRVVVANLTARSAIGRNLWMAILRGAGLFRRSF